jgi:hypothetical protein
MESEPPTPAQKIDRTPTPVETGAEQEYKQQHPDQFKSVEVRRDCEQEKGEFLRLVGEFERNHSLKKLNAIVNISHELVFIHAYDMSLTPEGLDHTLRHFAPDYQIKHKAKIATAKEIILTPEDQEAYRIRVVAKSDLPNILRLLTTLEKETDIAKPQLDELKAMYQKLSRAFGTVSTVESKKVDHTRG